MTNAIDNARKLLQEYDATEYLEADSRDFAHDFGVALRDLLDSLEYEYQCHIPPFNWGTCTEDDRFCPVGSERRRRISFTGEWEKVS